MITEIVFAPNGCEMIKIEKKTEQEKERKRTKKCITSLGIVDRISKLKEEQKNVTEKELNEVNN